MNETQTHTWPDRPLAAITLQPGYDDDMDQTVRSTTYIYPGDALYDEVRELFERVRMEHYAEDARGE